MFGSDRRRAPVTEDRAPAADPEEAEGPSGREPPGWKGPSGLVLAARVALGLAEIGGRGAGELAGRLVPRPLASAT
ncbi:MAG: hypothetical protein LBJ87_10275, partial [bacterium]|nr:hypothetical protein [bacterium]